MKMTDSSGIEELYKNFGVLADAGKDVGKVTVCVSVCLSVRVCE